MALVKCPSCQKRMSSMATVCSNCGYSRDPNAKVDPEQLKIHNKRNFRDRMYALRMFSYVAMTIAMVGALPMLWDYIKGLETEQAVVLLKHWGVYAVGAGFVLYLVIRILMIMTRKQYVQKQKAVDSM